MKHTLTLIALITLLAVTFADPEPSSPGVYEPYTSSEINEVVGEGSPLTIEHLQPSRKKLPPSSSNPSEQPWVTEELDNGSESKNGSSQLRRIGLKKNADREKRNAENT